MNYDPKRFCFECRKVKPTKGFRRLSRGSGYPRLACAECFTRLEAIRTAELAQTIDSGHRELT